MKVLIKRTNGKPKVAPKVLAPKMPKKTRNTLKALPGKAFDDIQIDYIKRFNKGQNIYFNSLAALRYNIPTGIILNMMLYWYYENLKKKINCKDGYYWTYNSASNIRLVHPYISERIIYLSIKALLDDEILIKSQKNHNKHLYDKTSWYRIDEARIYSIFGVSGTDILNSYIPT